MSTKKKVLKKVTSETAADVASKKPTISFDSMVEEQAEQIFSALHDDGFIAQRIYDDSNMGHDVLTCIEDTLREWYRG